MVNSPYQSFNASDRSYFSLMKKEIHTIGLQHGFSVRRTGELDIIVAEMASNLIKHAGGGEILVKAIEENGIKGVEIICIDNGPGMSEPDKMMTDGYSSSQTLGHGLGSIKRLSDTFQLYSLKGWGTIILSRIFKTERKQAKELPIAEIKSLLVCKPGERVCGDGCSVKISNNHIALLLGDGLGHGPDAHAAANAAIQSFQTLEETDPVEIIRAMNIAVKKTRGLVASIAVYNIREKKWHICGVGNISTGILQLFNLKNYITHNGIIGLNVPNTMKAQEIPGEKGQVMLMCSDGIKTKWELTRYTGIQKYDLSILAAAIYKDYARRTDDMSVLLCRINRNI